LGVTMVLSRIQRAGFASMKKNEIIEAAAAAVIA
jgi:hypothetical protein